MFGLELEVPKEDIVMLSLVVGVGTVVRVSGGSWNGSLSVVGDCPQEEIKTR